MKEKVGVYPLTTGGYVIVIKDDVMAGFSGFDEAREHAIAILSNRASFSVDFNIGDIDIDRKGTRAVFSRVGDKIEEKRYITGKDGITIEQEEYPVKKVS